MLEHLGFPDPIRGRRCQPNRGIPVAKFAEQEGLVGDGGCEAKVAIGTCRQFCRGAIGAYGFWRTPD